MRRYASSVAAQLAVGLLVIGCGQTPVVGDGNDIGGCSEDGQCGSGEKCVGGACVAAGSGFCILDEDCAGDDEICVAGACVQVEEPECREDSDCVSAGLCENPDTAVCVHLTCRYEAAAADQPCDDGDPCTVSDRCDGAKACVGTPSDCPALTPCGSQAECLGDQQCIDSTCLDNDGQNCTSNIECVNVCIFTVCSGISDPGGPCDDDGDCVAGNICGEANTCLAANGEACTLSTGCASGNCADGYCCDTSCEGDCMGCSENKGRCAPRTGPCDDSDPCSHSDSCVGGLCLGTVYTCHDDNPCTTDDCTGDGGCEHDDLHNEPCGVCSICDGDTCSGVTVDNGPECEDECTYCEAGACLSYGAGMPGECAADWYCCGTPLACEGSSETCPGQLGILFGFTDYRFAAVVQPRESLFIY